MVTEAEKKRIEKVKWYKDSYKQRELRVMTDQDVQDARAKRLA